MFIVLLTIYYLDCFNIFKYFSKYTTMRDLADGRRSMILIFETGVGKTWMTQRLDRNTYCCMVSLKETGFGR